MPKDYSISFVIPTRNRSEFIEPLIKRCLEIRNSIVIISDNSDVKVIDKLIEKFDNSRIIYNYYPDKLSVIDNFNLSLTFVKTTYVCYLGDDDMIGPGFEKALSLMFEFDIDVLNVQTVNRPLQYFWPNNPSKHWGDLGGKLYFGDFKGGLKRNDNTKSLNHAKSNFGLGPLTLPRVYLGIVKIDLIEKIIKKHNSLFNGYSPDIYSSYLLSLESSNSYTFDFPIIIPGACSKSTSSARASRTDVGSLLNNDHLGRFSNVNWDRRIPEFYSPYNIWASTFLIGLEKNGDQVSQWSFAHLYALNMMNSNFSSKKLNKAINALAGTRLISKLGVLIMIFYHFSSLLFQKILQVAKFAIYKRPGAAKNVIIENLNSYDAYLALNDFYSRNGFEVKFISEP
jgi:glycosyltransferase involved in cell wall biosynthesis